MSADLRDLCEHDRNVLDSIFDPYQVGQENSSALNKNYDEDLPETLIDSYSGDDNPEAIKCEIDAIKLTEEGKYEEALRIFSEALTLIPTKASIWNNRAQTYRLMDNDADALSDLNKALELSNYSGRTGCRALCQRGLLKRKNGDIDSARDDFNKAAILGSKFARTQLVEINPYAALCNQMLKETFAKLKSLE